MEEKEKSLNKLAQELRGNLSAFLAAVENGRHNKANAYLYNVKDDLSIIKEEYLSQYEDTDGDFLCNEVWTI